MPEHLDHGLTILIETAAGSVDCASNYNRGCSAHMSRSSAAMERSKSPPPKETQQALRLFAKSYNL